MVKLSVIQGGGQDETPISPDAISVGEAVKRGLTPTEIMILRAKGKVQKPSAMEPTPTHDLDDKRTVAVEGEDGLTGIFGVGAVIRGIEARAVKAMQGKNGEGKRKTTE